MKGTRGFVFQRNKVQCSNSQSPEVKNDGFDQFCLFLVVPPIVRSAWEFFFNVETSPLSEKDYTFWPLLMTIEQWEFLSVPYVLWHRPSVLEVVTLKSVAGHLPVKFSLSVLTTLVCCDQESTNQLPTGAKWSSLMWQRLLYAVS